MTGPEGEERDRQVADRWGGWVHDNDIHTEIVSICMYVSLRFNIQIVGLLWI